MQFCRHCGVVAYYYQALWINKDKKGFYLLSKRCMINRWLFLIKELRCLLKI